MHIFFKRSLFLIFLSVSFTLYSEEKEEIQKFEAQLLPTIQTIGRNDSKEMITLDDGSVWEAEKFFKDGETIWQLGGKVVIRWDNAVGKYFFCLVDENYYLSHPKALKSYVTMIEPPRYLIQSKPREHIQLSNGLLFKYISFIGEPQIGDRVLISLNENSCADYYPYFLVGYKFNDQGENQGWQVTGEVQGRLIN